MDFFFPLPFLSLTLFPLMSTYSLPPPPFALPSAMDLPASTGFFVYVMRKIQKVLLQIDHGC